MTDKEKLDAIRAEVQNYIYAAHKAHTNITEGNFAHLLSFIDSLQEEPVSIWHDANEKPNFKEKGSIFVITSLNGEYIGSRYYNYNDITINFGNYDKWAYLNDLVNLSNVQRTTKDWKEPVSEELEEAAVEWYDSIKYKSDLSGTLIEGFKDGAQWQKENLWKPADGDDLPEIDREVIVLIKYNAQRNIHDEEYPTYRVGFGYRPNPDGWDGRNIDTNEVTHYTPKLYDKGGWNAPNIVYWLDVRLPKEIGL